MQFRHSVRPLDVAFEATPVSCHALKDPLAALSRMAELLRPGGMVIVEDADASANFCYPQNVAFNAYSRL